MTMEVYSALSLSGHVFPCKNVRLKKKQFLSINLLICTSVNVDGFGISNFSSYARLLPEEFEYFKDSYKPSVTLR